MRRITIDPGVNGTGYAIWDKRWKLISYGIIRGKSKNWEKRMVEISKRLKTLVGKCRVTTGYIEKPKKFQGVFGGMVADRGDLVKLSMFVGFCSGFLMIPMETVEVIKWKGQLPKDIVEKRVKKLLPEAEDAKSHAIDAIGIGLYLSGRF